MEKLNATVSREINHALMDIRKNKNFSPRFRTAKKASKFLSRFILREDADSRVQAMKKEIQALGGRIEFKIEQYPDGSWAAESVNIDGVITGGTNAKEITSSIRDAVFTYFGIPSHLCNNEMLKADNKPVKLAIDKIVLFV